MLETATAIPVATPQITTTPRIPWLDTLRSLSLFGIILLHTGRMSEGVAQYISSFDMPVFFLISGLLVKPRIRQQALIPFIADRARRLLIPYCTFGLISYVLWLGVIGRIKGDVLPSQPIAYFLTHMAYGVGGHGWLNFNITLWFFPCLFGVELLFFGLIRLPNAKVFALAVGLLSIGGFYGFKLFDIAQGRLPWGIDLAATGVVFYSIGYGLRSYLLNPANTGWYSPIARILGLVLYIAGAMLNPESAFVVGNFGPHYLGFYLAALSGILFWAQVARSLPAHKVFDQIGQNTLVIFPFHLLLFPLFTGVLVYLFKVPKAAIAHSNLVGIGYTIAAIIVLLPVAWGLNRYAPYLVGRGRSRLA